MMFEWALDIVVGMGAALVHALPRMSRLLSDAPMSREMVVAVVEVVAKLF